jgi:cytoskeletal protein RodZ
MIVLNKRMLDVFGRLSLLSPQPPVMEILKKGGIHNIVKIFANEAELMWTSEQMTGQAPAPAGASAQAPQPQSEFDQLRSEIGSAFTMPSAASSQRREEYPAAAPASPFAEPSYPSFQPQPSMRAPYAAPPKPPQQFTPPPGPAPRYVPPPPPLRPFEPSAAKPAARAYTPPPKPAPMPAGAETRRMPPVQAEASFSMRPQVEPMAAPPEEDLEKFEATLEKRAVPIEVKKADVFDDELTEAPKKRSFVPVLVVLLLLIALGGGGYYAYITYLQPREQQGAAPAAPVAVQPPKQEAPVPQLPTEGTAQTPQTATPAAQQPAQTTGTPSATPPAEEVKKPAAAPAVREPVKPAPAKKRVAEARQSRPRPEPIPRPAPVREKPKVEEPVVTETRAEPTPSSSIEVIEEPPAPPPKVAVVTERPPEPVAPPPAPVPEPPAAAAEGGEAASVFIASIPPVADIYMDGKLVGKTNISELKVVSGKHTMRFVKGDKEITKEMTFQPGKNPSQMVRLP